MTWDVTADTLHRTVKLLVDSGKCRSPEEAEEYLRALVLQVVVGPDLAQDPAAQAALLTLVNAGRRAFLGGVHVALAVDCPLDVPWANGRTAADTVAHLGGEVVGALDPERPTLAVARPESVVGTPVLHVTHAGWAGGIVEDQADRLTGAAITPAGVAAAAFGISEMFQQALGDPQAGRRDVGVSLWRPDLTWRDPEGLGPPLKYLPAALWLLGLGHLGQAYAWIVGMLLYANPADCHVSLVDYDRVVEGNDATQLLVHGDQLGRRKTRIVAEALEGLGFNTQLVERAFDDHFQVDLTRAESTIALAGFDGRDPRLLLGDAGFTWVVDGGLGRGPFEYLNVMIHTFPSPEPPAEAFPPERQRRSTLPAAYKEEIERQVADGYDAEAVKCGMLSIAGVSIGAAFVGAFAASLVVADVLRLLHGGSPFSVVHVDLRSPAGILAVSNSAPGSASPRFTLAQE